MIMQNKNLLHRFLIGTLANPSGTTAIPLQPLNAISASAQEGKAMVSNPKAWAKD